MVADETNCRGEPLLRGTIGVRGGLRRSKRDDFNRHLGPPCGGAGSTGSSFLFGAHEFSIARRTASPFDGSRPAYRSDDGGGGGMGQRAGGSLRASKSLPPPRSLQLRAALLVPAPERIDDPQDMLAAKAVLQVARRFWHEPAPELHVPARNQPRTHRHQPNAPPPRRRVHGRARQAGARAAHRRSSPVKITSSTSAPFARSSARRV